MQLRVNSVALVLQEQPWTDWNKRYTVILSTGTYQKLNLSEWNVGLYETFIL
jgi:hypothetical protein